MTQRKRANKYALEEYMIVEQALHDLTGKHYSYGVAQQMLGDGRLEYKVTRRDRTGRPERVKITKLNEMTY